MIVLYIFIIIIIISLILDAKNWKMKSNNFHVKESIHEFTKSIKCPDPQNCEIELDKEFYLSFSKSNDTDFQNTNMSNEHNIYRKVFINETSTALGNIFAVIRSLG